MNGTIHPAMLKRILLLLVWVSAVWGELVPGQWEGGVEGQPVSHTYLLEIGPPTTRRFSLSVVAPGGRSAEVMVAGTYTVTAEDGDSQLALSVERIHNPQQRTEQNTAELAGWTLETGQSAHCVLRMEGKDRLLDALDPQSQAPLVRFRLHPVGEVANL